MENNVNILLSIMHYKLLLILLTVKSTLAVGTICYDICVKMYRIAG